MVEKIHLFWIGHVPPMRYEKHEKITQVLTDFVFVRQDAKKGPRFTMALDRRWFFQGTAELQKTPIYNSASI